jgi:predicted transcriptional regulator
MVEAYNNRKYNFSHGPDFGRMYNNSNNNSTPTDDMDLNEWELRILSALKSSSKTERRICKEVKLNTSIVSELITALIEKGLISSTRKRKLHFYSSESFSTTLDALKILQNLARNQKKSQDGLIEQILAFATYWLR